MVHAHARADHRRFDPAGHADSAKIASIGLHGRAGFRTVGTFQPVGFKLGRRVDSVSMQHDLGDGDRTMPRSLDRGAN
jgi:L-amino acid N-acyltransferase YncA